MTTQFYLGEHLKQKFYFKENTNQFLLMLHVYVPYCVHAHDGICKENWVVLDVGTTEVKKPCKEENHILLAQNVKNLFHNTDNPVVIFLKVSLMFGRCLNKSQSPV